MGGDKGLGPDVRDEISSICRETAKSLDMTRRGSGWKYGLIEAKISDKGIKNYGFTLKTINRINSAR